MNISTFENDYIERTKKASERKDQIDQILDRLAHGERVYYVTYVSFDNKTELSKEGKVTNMTKHLIGIGDCIYVVTFHMQYADGTVEEKTISFPLGCVSFPGPDTIRWTDVNAEYVEFNIKVLK